LCENISLVNKAHIVLQGNVAEIRASHSTRTLMVRSAAPVSSDSCEIISQNKVNGVFETSIRKIKEMSNNDFLTELMKQTEIHSFEELLPTMNDIFISTVKNSENINNRL
ncbi:MAG TPA: DUF4162 domain-containing protein, partial [Paludibacteraceae bacterium]|nr:DUF4162 domain-containing protein [Paludibacteraceae bacterium]